MSFQVDDGLIESLDGREIADTIIRARNATQAVGDDLGRLIEGYGPKLYAWRDSAKSVNNNTWYNIEFDAEDYDTAGFHDITTNPTDIIIPQDGRYLVIVQGSWAANSTGDRLLDVQVNETGAHSGGTQIMEDQRVALNGRATSLQASTIYNFYRGDIIHVYVLQTSGGALSMNISSATPGAQNYIVISRLGDIQD